MIDLSAALLMYITENILTEYTPKVNAFTDVRPNKPDSLLVVNEYDSGQGKYNNICATRYVQIQIRHKSNSVAKAHCWQVFNHLGDVKHENFVELSDRLVAIYVQKTPRKLLVDDQGRYVWFIDLAITSRNEI